jgi:hypothetical protein
MSKLTRPNSSKVMPGWASERIVPLHLVFGFTRVFFFFNHFLGGRKSIGLSLKFVLSTFLPPQGLKTLFFILYNLFRIIDGTSFMVKDGDDTSLQLSSKN